MPAGDSAADDSAEGRSPEGERIPERRSAGAAARVGAGLLVRLTADRIAMAPPYISRQEEILNMIESLRGAPCRIAR